MAQPDDARTSLVDEAYREFKRAILSNSLPPGFQANEQEIALRLGMSRTPVHAAVIRLQQEGLVQVLPRKGVRIVSTSAEDMREIYEVLTALEVAAVKRLASNVGEAVEGVLKALDDATSDMERALDHDDLDGWAEADSRFHRLLVEGCGNKRLAGMAATVMDQSHRARIATLPFRPKPTDSTRDHRAVVEALRAGDIHGATEIHRTHREQGSARMLDLLQRYRLTRL